MLSREDKGPLRTFSSAIDDWSEAADGTRASVCLLTSYLQCLLHSLMDMVVSANLTSQIWLNILGILETLPAILIVDVVPHGVATWRQSLKSNRIHPN